MCIRDRIKTAGTVAEALKICRDWEPDLAILDVMLPDGNGFSLFEQMRTFTEVPVLFLTCLLYTSQISLPDDEILEYIENGYDIQQICLLYTSHPRRLLRKRFGGSRRPVVFLLQGKL